MTEKTKRRKGGPRTFGFSNGKMPLNVIGKTASAAGLRKITTFYGMFGSPMKAQAWKAMKEGCVNKAEAMCKNWALVHSNMKKSKEKHLFSHFTLLTLLISLSCPYFYFS